ncbi:MAG: BREX-1 system phosphatase PglZ type A [Saccharofermentanales bacterium]
MPDNTTLALNRLFEKHRIIFWTDTEKKLREQFDALELPGVEKIELQNNEYSIKHRILREQPMNKFLLYREGPDPDDLGNWLLDVQKASYVFRTDQIGIWLSDLGLGTEFTSLVQQHQELFKSSKRFESLKAVLAKDDTPRLVRLKMMAVCAGSDVLFENVLENLLQELSIKRNDKISQIITCNLIEDFWERLEREFGYSSSDPSISDFALELFRSSFEMGINGKPKLKQDALVFLKRWKDSKKFSTSFRVLSDEYAKVLNIESELNKTDFRLTLGLDYFRLIDQKVISELVEAVATRTIPSNLISSYINRRRDLFWFDEYRHLYEAIDSAACFFQILSEVDLNIVSMQKGIESYTSSWYQIDQLYRKFIFHVRQAGNSVLFEKLSEQVENHYTNNFLMKLNDRWQNIVEKSPRWDAGPFSLQRWFFDRRVASPYLNRGKKVCVIVSDALRYEIGEELLRRIRQEDRFEAELGAMLSMLPSYTQLGMAALLPNKELIIAEDNSGVVYVNGQNSSGLVNRQKILQQGITGKAYVASSEEIMALGRDDARSLFRDNDLVYIFHNRIDSIGDKMESEERVIEAAEETIDDLINMIKKLTNANFTNLLITADHGFIYQNKTLAESDFAGEDATGDEILYRNRRFVIGKGLNDSTSLMKLNPDQIGLSGSLQIQIPKSINRLRLKGSGMRFVHGGASLQEAVIPVIEVNKKRASDIGNVDVEILRSGSNAITSGQLLVTLYQTDTSTEKLQPRRLRAGIFTESGELISDSHEITFDRISENPRDREFPVRFILARQSDAYNGQEVILKLEEKYAGTTTYQEYKSLRYTLRRSFTSDF